MIFVFNRVKIPESVEKELKVGLKQLPKGYFPLSPLLEMQISFVVGLRLRNMSAIFFNSINFRFADAISLKYFLRGRCRGIFSLQKPAHNFTVEHKIPFEPIN